MSTTWILVAHETGARIFENTGPGKGLGLLHEIEHPSGHARDQDINADKPGRGFGPGGTHHSLATAGESPSEHAHAGWARHLAGTLKNGHESGKCSSIILVAGPKFLGLLREALDKETVKHVTASLDKDLAHMNEAEVTEHLKDTIRL